MIDSKKVFRPCIHAAVRRIESWLVQQAASGWKLIDYRNGIFTFAKTTPFDAAYFMYSGFNGSRGFRNDFYSARKKYGKNKNKSQLNKDEASDIFEIDLAKADSCLPLLRAMRNRFYMRHYLLLLLFFVIPCIAFSYGWLAKKVVSCAPFAIITLLGTAWSVMSICLLRTE